MVPSSSSPAMWFEDRSATERPSSPWRHLDAPSGPCPPSFCPGILAMDRPRVCVSPTKTSTGDRRSHPRALAREVSAILSGYFGSAAQPVAVARLVEAARQSNPDLLYVCDPVMGDLGGLYVPVETASAIRDRLIPIADLATPNRYELQWMAGSELSSNQAIIDAALSLGPKRMLVTSAVPIWPVERAISCSAGDRPCLPSTG